MTKWEYKEIKEPIINCAGYMSILDKMTNQGWAWLDYKVSRTALVDDTWTFKGNFKRPIEEEK